MEDKKHDVKVIESNIDALPLDVSTNNLINAIIAEESPAKLKDMTHLFRVHMAKKNIIRLIKYYDMIDLVNSQTLQRLEKRPDEISNKDLLSFMTALLTSVEKASNALDALDGTTSSLIINQQQNEVNINLGGNLNRESKERVVDAIKSLMSLIAESKNEDNIIDIEDTDED